MTSGDVPRLDDVLRRAADRLARAGVPSPRPDAELLAAHVMEVSRGELVAAALRGTGLPEERAQALEALIVRRIAREPLQHLTGRAPFADLELEVGPGVFVPRPESEVVLERAVRELSAHPGPVVVDLCTGSAAIALAVARAVESARVVALELDQDALTWARLNVARQAAGRRVDLRAGDVRTAATGVLADLVGRVDVVTANPPYIPDDAVPLEVEVADHDPAAALYGGGQDGLDVPRAVLACAVQLLRPGGLVLMEHGETQGAQTRREAERAGLVDGATVIDRAGRDRVLAARRPGADSIVAGRR